MLSASQALNLLSIFVPKKYKGLKQCKQAESNVNNNERQERLPSIVWIPDYPGIYKIQMMWIQKQPNNVHKADTKRQNGKTRAGLEVPINSREMDSNKTWMRDIYGTVCEATP